MFTRGKKRTKLEDMLDPPLKRLKIDPEAFGFLNKKESKKNFSVNGYINYLPDEVLMKIFNNLSTKDIACSVRPVCRRWHTLSMNKKLWLEIKAGHDVPTNVLVKWLKNAPNLKRLEIFNRNDASIILKTVQRYNKKIEDLVVMNCWGSTERVQVPSAPLCNMLERFVHLQNINFVGTKFSSRKFFRLLASREFKSRKRRNSLISVQYKYTNYIGTANLLQLREFVKARRKATNSTLALFTLQNGHSVVSINDLQVDNSNEDEQLVEDVHEMIDNILPYAILEE